MSEIPGSRCAISEAGAETAMAAKAKGVMMVNFIFSVAVGWDFDRELFETDVLNNRLLSWLMFY